MTDQGTLTENTETVDELASEHSVSPNTKAAEKKLKEMSRKAKERGGPKNEPRTRSASVINQN